MSWLSGHFLNEKITRKFCSPQAIREIIFQAKDQQTTSRFLWLQIQIFFYFLVTFYETLTVAQLVEVNSLNIEGSS